MKRMKKMYERIKYTFELYFNIQFTLHYDELVLRNFSEGILGKVETPQQ